MKWKVRIMKYIKLAVILIVSIAMTACSSASASLTNKISFKENKDAVIKNAASLKDAVNTSGLDIFKQSVKSDKGKNVIVSPLSIFTAFSLLSNGAQGDTKSQINEAFCLKDNDAKGLNDNMNALINLLNNKNLPSNTGSISIYNSIWFDDNFKISSDFLNTAKAFYDCDAFKEKLSKKSTVDKMNKWVGEKSSGLINDPFKELDDSARMVLVNLLNFKGKWVTKFNKTNTKVEDFYLKDKKSIKASLMNREGMMQYYEDSEVQSCILDYYNGRMIVLLPKGDIDNYINSLTNEKINICAENTTNSIVKLKFPKFKTEYKKEINDTLRSLGIKKAFEPESAEFNSLHEDNSPLWIGQVLHDCVIEVDEEGTTASALTSVQMSGSAMPKDTHEMYVNKPFVFIIQDNMGTNLFMGKIENANS
jgi:serpin B